jgi:hypothetical protein
MPAEEEVTSFQLVTAEKYPSLPDVCTCDGVTLNFQSTKDHHIQQMYYNDWTHGHYVSNIFVFVMECTIQNCGINAWCVICWIIASFMRSW